MAQTDTVNKLIADLKAVTAPRAITPAGVARILQEITKLTAGTADAGVVAQLQAAIDAAQAAADAAKNTAADAELAAADAIDKADAATAAAANAVIEARTAANSASVKAANAATLAAEAKEAATVANNAAYTKTVELKQYIGIYEIKAITYHPREYADALPGDAVWGADSRLFYVYDAHAGEWSTDNALNARDSIGNIVSPAMDKLFRLENVLYHAVDDGVAYALSALVDVRDVQAAQAETLKAAKRARGVINMHTEFYDELGPITRSYTLSEMLTLLDNRSPNNEYIIPGIIIIYNDSDTSAITAYAWKGVDTQSRNEWNNPDNWQRLW
ncbi:MAG: hypothetical protein ACI30W_01695 [Muribaculaceae bacterium]